MSYDLHFVSDNQEALKTLSTRLHSKLKKIQGLFKDVQRNLRTFQGKMEFKDFSRTPPKIQGLFKPVRTLDWNLSSGWRCITFEKPGPGYFLSLKVKF